jgi:hypothetical protein
MGYRSCLGLLNLAKRFGSTRLEAACQRAMVLGSPTRRSVVPFALELGNVVDGMVAFLEAPVSPATLAALEDGDRSRFRPTLFV